MNKYFNLEMFKIAVKIGVLIGQQNPDRDPNELTEIAAKIQMDEIKHEV